MPGSTGPRTSRSSVYGPTASAATTLSRARLNLDPLLERDRDLRARARDGVDGGGRARQGGDARNAVHERGLADQVAVRARAVSLRRVDHEVAAAAADEVDDGGAAAVLDHLPHALDVEP